MKYFVAMMLVLIFIKVVATSIRVQELSDTAPLVLKLERCEVELRAYKTEMDETLRPNWEDVE